MLADASPKLAAQWSDKNPFGPDQVKRSSPQVVIWNCPCGCEFEKAIYQRTRAKSSGMACPNCAIEDRKTMTIKSKTLAEADTEMAEQWGPENTLTPSRVGFKSGKPAHWICPRGHSFWKSPLDRMESTSASRGCSECLEEMRAEGHRRGHAIAGKLKAGTVTLAVAAPSLVPQWGPLNECSPDEVAATSYTEYHWICPAGHDFWEKAVVRTYSTTASQGCSACYKENKHEGCVTETNSFAFRFPEMAARWSSKNKKKPSDYAGMSVHEVYFDCGAGHTYKTRICSAAIGRGCPVCSKRTYRRARRTPFSVACPELVAEWSTTNDKNPDEVGYGNQELVWWKCSADDDHPEWQSTPHNRADGNGRCPTCNPTSRSYAETELFDILSRLGVQGVRSERSLLSPYELDIYIADKDTAIEFNGLYWHQEDKRGQDSHQEKALLCRAAGVQLIQVWEDDWAERPMVVLTGILTKLGHLDDAAKIDARFVRAARRVSARSCEIVMLLGDQTDAFLAQHHIQGAKSGSVRLGLRDKSGVLVAVLTASVSGEKATIERYATSCLVRGGFGRLESALRASVPDSVKTLLTFADLSISNGGLYESRGWKNDGELAPDYSYIVNKKRVHKFNYRIKRFRNDPDLRFEEEMTERELADLNGIARVYDAGKIRYTKEISS